MSIKSHVKVGDQVMVIAGKDKGKTGQVSKVWAEDSRVLVEGINLVKRHTKPDQRNPEGGIVEKSLPIHISNVLLLDPKSNKGTRTGRKFVEGAKGSRGHWARFSRKTDTVFDTK